MAYADAVFAQQGMTWYGSGGWGHHSAYGMMYDNKAMTEITGEVVSVDSDDASNARRRTPDRQDQRWQHASFRPGLVPRKIRCENYAWGQCCHQRVSNHLWWRADSDCFRSSQRKWCFSVTRFGRLPGLEWLETAIAKLWLDHELFAIGYVYSHPLVTLQCRQLLIPLFLAYDDSILWFRNNASYAVWKSASSHTVLVRWTLALDFYSFFSERLVEGRNHFQRYNLNNQLKFI